MSKGAARLLAIAAALALIATGSFWLRSRVGEPAAPPSSRAGGKSDPRNGPAVEIADIAVLPASLIGTSEDGALVTDDEGRFVPTSDALDLFDYYLAATGEESDDRIRARIVAAIHARLDGDGAREAEALLDDYHRYRARAAELLTGELIGEDLERRLQYIRELRREVFGADAAEALFGEEEARWFADLERRRVATDSALSPEEREARLAALEAELPEQVRTSHQAARSHSTLRGEEARLRAEGSGVAEINQLREERFGAEAAVRLDALDAARAEWDARVDAYRIERDQRLAGVPEDERGSVVEEVRSRHFEGGELMRVRALDRALDRAASR